MRSCVLATLVLVPVVANGAEPPNVVYIMADELAYYELSLMGHPQLRTPRIDRLAEEGLRFTRAYAGSSVCAPTRCCLLTGKHGGHTSVRSNGGGTPLRASEATIASLLKPAGYATGGFGKWGCGGRGSTGVPEQHGFDLFVGYYDQVHAHSYYPPYLIRNSEELPLAGNNGGRAGETYSQYVIVDQAKQFIREHRDQPFLCYLPFTPPHGNFDIPDSDPAWALFRDRQTDGEPWPADARRYAAMVAMLDRQVGEILDLLRELGLDERTIVFFSGDNGGNDYFPDKGHPRGFLGPNVDPRTGAEFRGHKGNLYEGGLRVPLLARWPGRIEPRRVTEHVCYFPDILPTICELAGVEAPRDSDGLSLVPELLGAQAAGREQPRHEFLYWELSGQVAVRAGDWKGVRPGASRPWELYDLAQDPGETRNLAESQPERLAELRALAEREHIDAVEGEFHDRTLHERDRQAKFGFGEGATRPPQSGQPRRPQPQPGRRPNGRPAAGAETLPRTGLVPREAMKVVRVSSESTFNGKLAANAIDGDVTTIWHSAWQGGVAQAPHELVLDLGEERTIRGVRYLARQDGGWNGTLGKCELYVGAAPDDISRLAGHWTFAKQRTAQEGQCEPVRGRYVRLRILTEVNDGPWASIAELGVIGD